MTSVCLRKPSVFRVCLGVACVGIMLAMKILFTVSRPSTAIPIGRAAVVGPRPFSVVAVDRLEPSRAPATPPSTSSQRPGDCPGAPDYRQVNHAVPRTLLYSFEGSGNTWARILIQNVTGTCSVLRTVVRPLR